MTDFDVVAAVSVNVIMLTLDESYVDPARVAMDTALRNSDSTVGTLIASVGLSAGAKRSLREISQTHDRPCRILDVEHLVEGLPNGLPRFSPAAWARVFVDRYVPDGVERVLYLDADTYTRADLSPLIGMDLEGMPMAAVADVVEPVHNLRGSDFWRPAGTSPDAGYFNTGVLLIDVAEWRRRQISQRVADVIEAGTVPMRSVDQDALNAVAWREWVHLESGWNHWGSVPEAAERAMIVHFVGDAKPWKVETRVGLFQAEYERAATRVGWQFDRDGRNPAHPRPGPDTSN